MPLDANGDCDGTVKTTTSKTGAVVVFEAKGVLASKAGPHARYEATKPRLVRDLVFES
jgi:hypothetical protein